MSITLSFKRIFREMKESVHTANDELLAMSVGFVLAD